MHRSAGMRRSARMHRSAKVGVGRTPKAAVRGLPRAECSTRFYRIETDNQVRSLCANETAERTIDILEKHGRPQTLGMFTRRPEKV